MTAIDDFRAAIAAAGLTPPDRIEPGQLHRFPAADKSNGNTVGWCKLFLDGLGGIYGDWSTGLCESWQAKRDQPLTADERRAFRLHCEVEQKARAAEQAELHAQAAKRAEVIYRSATDDPARHAYAIKKRVLLGDRVRRGAWPQRGWADALIIPLYDEAGKLTSLEAINVDSAKDFLKDAKKAGSAYFFGRIRGAERILIGEGVATVAACYAVTQIPSVAAMDAGNLLPVARNVRKHPPSAEIIFLADNDIRPDGKNPGVEAATKAAQEVGGKVAVPELDGRKCDFWDLWNERGENAVQNAIFRGTPAKPANCAEPRAVVGLEHGEKCAKDVLIFREFEPPDYPIDALGPLAGVAKAIAKDAQLDPAMAGQCALATAALLAQGRANVRTLAGVKPLSLYLVTIGESGDGKTTAEGAALAAIRDWQRAKTREYDAETSDWTDRCTAAKKRKEALPDPPRAPYLIMRDGTLQGIRRAFGEGMPSQGCFTSEGAVMLGGYGMSPDNRAKTASALSALWDDGEVSVSRALTGRVQLYDRRFSIHWLIQPDAAANCLNDPALSNIGFWPRFLAAWPAPNKPRTAAPFEPGRVPVIGEFWRRCSALLVDLPGSDCADLPIISVSREAGAYLARFFESMEQSAKTRGGLLADIRPFAIRATEQAHRIAGVLAVFAGEPEISADAARNAVRLATYALETWNGIFGVRQDMAIEADAGRLLAWLQKHRGTPISASAMLQIGPRGLRSRSKRDAALAVLEQRGLIGRAGDYWEVVE